MLPQLIQDLTLPMEIMLSTKGRKRCNQGNNHIRPTQGPDYPSKISLELHRLSEMRKKEAQTWIMGWLIRVGVIVNFRLVDEGRHNSV